MSDLISRKEVEKVIDELELYTVGRLKKQNVHITVAELQELIDSLKSIATAYSVEKVVAELEEEIEKIEDEVWRDCEERVIKQLAFGEAIEIVRNGGKE